MARKDRDEERGLGPVPKEASARTPVVEVAPLITSPLMFGSVRVHPEQICALRWIHPTATVNVASIDTAVPETPADFARLLNRNPMGTDRFCIVARVGGREVVSGQVFVNPSALISFHPPKDKTMGGDMLVREDRTMFHIRRPNERSADMGEGMECLNLRDDPERLGMVHTHMGAHVVLSAGDYIYLPDRGLFSAEQLLDVQEQTRGNTPGLSVDAAPPLRTRARKALE